VGGSGAWLRGLAAGTTLGMFVVLVMGATVTNTGSAEGCGRSWPLCNGQFVPEFTVSTAIEYSHRAVTGVEGVLVVALTVAMLGRWRTDREVLALAALMLGTLVLQAGLGAGAVLEPQSPFMLASHFGVSLVAFASTFLSAAVVFERTRGTPGQVRRATARFRRWVTAVGVYMLGVVYLGAYVRHAGVSLACADWPLCNGQVVPSLEGPTAVVFAHRSAAVGAMVLLAWLVQLARQEGLGQRTAWAGLGLVMLQGMSGAVVVWTRLGLFSTLAHAAIMAVLFAALALLTRQVWRRARRLESELVGRPHGRSEQIHRRLHQAEGQSNGAHIVDLDHPHDEAERRDRRGLPGRSKAQLELTANRQLDALDTRPAGAQIDNPNLDKPRQLGTSRNAG
jgi:cytochrome c oxidase assembly protein subunit 15